MSDGQIPVEGRGAASSVPYASPSRRMLSLKTDTDAAWAEEAMRDLDRVLIDHAHCEMKAASNALSLAARHHEVPAVVRALTLLAREEIEHFQRVLTLLEERGLAMGPPPVDTYAATLRREAAADMRGPRLGPLVDRLLVGALIEARSCERFKLLAEALARAGESRMSAFYAELLAAEARHYRELMDLAVVAASAPGPTRGTRDDVLARLDFLAEREGAIVRNLARGAPATRVAIHG
jgi:tRNA 2-(methylsulfanyl)-N6-isopentenyladenosine37 hydroxylase